jgi:hypothetical protein
MKNRIFRLRLHKDRVSIPAQYILIDEALETIGRSLYPDLWGHTRGYSYLPFNAQYQRCVLIETEKGWQQDWVAVDLATLPLMEASRLWKHFSSVSSALIEAAEAGYLRIYPIDVIVGLGEPLRHGVPSLQRNLITYTGTVLTNRTAPSPTVAVVLKQELQHWIDSGGLKKVFQDDDEVRSAKAVVQRHIRLFLEYLNKYDLRVTRAWAFQVLREAAENPLSENSLMNDFWKQTAKSPMPQSRKLKGRCSPINKRILTEHYHRAVAATRGDTSQGCNEKPEAIKSS